MNHTMKKRSTAAVLLAGSLLGGALPATAALSATAAVPMKTGTVKVTVVGPSTPAAAAVGVTVYLGKIGKQVDRKLTAVTDASGVATITNVPVDDDWEALSYGGGGYARSDVNTGARSIDVKAGKTTTADLRVVVASTVHGRVISAVDGSPITGAALGDGLTLSGKSFDIGITSATDGTFTDPNIGGGTYEFAAQKKGWAMDDYQTTDLPAQTASDMTLDGPLTMQPVGYADFSLESRTGHKIDTQWVALKSVTDASGDNARVWNYISEETNLAPALTSGTYKATYTVRNSLTTTVRKKSQTFSVRGGDSYTEQKFTLRFTSDAVTDAKVTTDTFRKAQSTKIGVKLPTYTDGTTPKLRTTLTINGVKAKHTHLTFAKSKSGARKAVISVPERYTHAKKLHVTAVVHATKAYSHSSSARVTLTQR